MWVAVGRRAVCKRTTTTSGIKEGEQSADKMRKRKKMDGATQIRTEVYRLQAQHRRLERQSHTTNN